VAIRSLPALVYAQGVYMRVGNRVCQV